MTSFIGQKLSLLREGEQQAQSLSVDHRKKNLNLEDTLKQLYCPLHSPSCYQKKQTQPCCTAVRKAGKGVCMGVEKETHFNHTLPISKSNFLQTWGGPRVHWIPLCSMEPTTKGSKGVRPQDGLVK